MKKLLTGIIISTALFGTSIANAESRQQIVDEIADYVYPNNQSKSPAAMTFMPDGQTYLQASEDKTRIVKYSTTDGAEVETVFDAEKTRENKIQNFEGFQLSDDGTKLLIYRNSKKIYRRSFEAEYYIFEIRRNTLKPLSATHRLQRSPLFAPDARSVAFVADNNIYVKRLDFDTEIEVTRDGKYGEIINGVPDWTYE